MNHSICEIVAFGSHTVDRRQLLLTT